MSDERLKPAFARYGVRLSDYEGPGSFATYLATGRGLGAESPAKDR